MEYDEIKIKLIIAVATFLVAFSSASAPLKLIDVDAHLFSVGNLMASGVLLSAGLVHQLPDSIEKFDLSSLDQGVHLAPFVTGLVFCLFLILEEYLHMNFDDHPFMSAVDREGSSDHLHRSHRGNSDADADAEHNNHRTELDPLLEVDVIQRKRERSASDASWISLSCRCDGESGRGITALEHFRSNSSGKEHEHHHDLEHVAEHIHGSLLASVILLFALSIHSVFDGLAIGISSNTKELISVTAAVVAHKGFAGYALGSSMVASKMNKRHFFVLVAVFSSCSPIGILLGTIFEQWDDVEGASGWKIICAGIINAMVAGTFLYISIVEIGMKEILICRDSKLLGGKLDQKQMQWSKLTAFLVGYFAMSSLATIV